MTVFESGNMVVGTLSTYVRERGNSNSHIQPRSRGNSNNKSPKTTQGGGGGHSLETLTEGVAAAQQASHNMDMRISMLDNDNGNDNSNNNDNYGIMNANTTVPSSNYNLSPASIMSPHPRQNSLLSPNFAPAALISGLIFF